VAQPPGAALVAVLFTAALEIAEQQAAVGPKVVLYMLPFAVVMVLLAARIWQTAARPAATTSPDTAVAALASSGRGI
jgi:ABC-type uncharacterized transport system permease subunit